MSEMPNLNCGKMKVIIKLLHKIIYRWRFGENENWLLKSYSKNILQINPSSNLIFQQINAKLFN
jgi:hypothetical protein